jgi:hypothetical protein
MDVNATPATSVAVAPAPAVHPGTVVVPPAAIIAAAADPDLPDAASEAELEARDNKGEKEYLCDGFH